MTVVCSASNHLYRMISPYCIKENMRNNARCISYTIFAKNLNLDMVNILVLISVIAARAEITGAVARVKLMQRGPARAISPE